MGTTRTDYISGDVTVTPAAKVHSVKVENTISLAASNSVASDVIQALKIPKGAFVSKVGIYVSTKEDSTLKGTVGDATADGWIVGPVDFESTGATISNDTDTGAYHVAGGKLYTADDTIDVTLDANIGNTAIFTVWAEYSIIEAVANA